MALVYDAKVTEVKRLSKALLMLDTSLCGINRMENTMGICWVFFKGRVSGLIVINIHHPAELRGRRDVAADHPTRDEPLPHRNDSKD